MKRNATSLTNALKSVLQGLGQAHHGEMLSPHAKLSVLAAGTRDSTNLASGRLEAAEVAPAGARALARPRRVVLAAGTSVSRDAARYAVDVCDRLSADLVVMSAADGTNGDAAIRRTIEAVRLPGTSWTLIGCESDLLCCVRKYVAAHAGVMFVVTDAMDLTGALGVSSRSGGRPQPARQVNVPWVVVTGGHDDAQCAADAA